MTPPPTSLSPDAARARERLEHLLKILARQGLTQQAVAARVNIAPQVLSDLKRGERPLSELVARRLGEQFDLSYRWLLGQSEDVQVERASENVPGDAMAQATWLPVFPWPIEGEPRLHPQWDGGAMAVAGAAGARLGQAEKPYLLRYTRDDTRGRLKSGDVLLISQDEDADAELCVVRYRQNRFLARRLEDGHWERAADGHRLSASCPVIGFAMGIVWAGLGPV